MEDSPTTDHLRHGDATAVVDRAHTLLEELPEERLLSVDAAWRLVREHSWDGQRLSGVVMGLVTSLRVAHDHCTTKVFWSTPQQDLSLIHI